MMNSALEEAHLAVEEMKRGMDAQQAAHEAQEREWRDQMSAEASRRESTLSKHFQRYVELTEEELQRARASEAVQKGDDIAI